MPQDWNRYGPTAARPLGATSGRAARPQSITIDIHSHVAVPQAADFVRPHLDPAAIPLFNFASPETRALNARQDSDRTAVMTSHDERLSDLDAMGIDLQVVMCPPPQCYYAVPLDIAAKAACIVNDGVAAYVAVRPDRFVAWRNPGLPSDPTAELRGVMTCLLGRDIKPA